MYICTYILYILLLGTRLDLFKLLVKFVIEYIMIKQALKCFVKKNITFTVTSIQALIIAQPQNLNLEF